MTDIDKTREEVLEVFFSWRATAYHRHYLALNTHNNNLYILLGFEKLDLSSSKPSPGLYWIAQNKTGVFSYHRYHSIKDFIPLHLFLSKELYIPVLKEFETPPSTNETP